MTPIVLDPPISALPGATNESLVLDDLELNEVAALSTLVDCFGIKELHMPPPAERLEYVQGDRDGSLLVRPPKYENRQITGTLWCAATTRDLVHERVGDITDLLQEAKQRAEGPDPMPLVWTPRRSTKSLTFYMKTGQLGEINQSAEAGYFYDRPIIEIPFTFDCYPFGYGDEIGTVTDTFDSAASLDSYTYDAGSGWTVSSGKLVPTSSSTKRIYYNALGYRPADLQSTIRYRTGASVGGGADVRISKRIDATNRLVCIVGNGSLVIRTVTAGVESANLGTTAAPSLSTSTDYWLRLQVSGNKVRAEHWTSAPTPTGTPAAVATHTLSGAAATLFGLGQPGDFGFSPSLNGTDWTFDEFTFEPNTVRSTDPIAAIVLPGVPGDVSAEGRLILTDSANQDRRFAEWGIESRHASLSNALLIDAAGDLAPGATSSEILATSGLAGSSGAAAWAYGGQAVTATLSTTPVAVCGLGSGAIGSLGHIGSYRIKARVQASTSTIYARLSWRTGSGPWKANPWQAMQQSGTPIELDLGTVEIPEARIGTQVWTGRIEAFDNAAAGSTLAVNYVELIPDAEGYGKVRSSAVFETPSVFAARDEFVQAAGNLNGKTLPQGGTWATSGGATDFAIEDTFHSLVRSASGASDRYAIAGTTTLTDVLAQLDFKFSGFLPGTVGPTGSSGLLVRYIDANNFFAVTRDFDGVLRAVRNIAGSFTVISGRVLPPIPAGTPCRLRVVVDASGRWTAWFSTVAEFGPQPLMGGRDAALATGGTLASGKVGIFDQWAVLSGTVTRTYDNFWAAVPNRQAVFYTGRQVEFRHDGTEQQDPTGGYYAELSSRGSEFFVPPSGSEGRIARIVATARRNDIEEYEDSPLGDGLQVQAVIRPRYLQVPR